MDGEAHGESSTQLPGEDAAQSGEALAGSGWTTTKQAAKVLGVSRRSVQGYVRRGLLEAKEEGEGVNKRFLVFIDSLNALSERRRRDAEQAANFAEASAATGQSANLAANAGEGLRHAIDRLEARTEEATELRIRLELTERAESTLREELAEERRRREEAEREHEDLRRELQVLREARESPETTEEAPDRPEEPRSSIEGRQEGVRRSWWRRVLGG
jgi:hypothetical protein